MTKLSSDCFNAGYAVVDLGSTGMKLHGFRFLLTRMSDRAIFHYATAKQVREKLAFDVVIG